MSTNRTFTMLKPDAIAKGYMIPILNKIDAAGFKIVAMKLTQLDKQKASEFYGIHKEKPFFNELVAYMTSGPIVAAVLEKSNAVEDFRTLIGATDPKQALKGTIRNQFAESIAENAIHGSDSDENALIESEFHFENNEIVTY
ncbi:nucleoside-diphosphate kinase [Flavicella sp.]|uniref:nucleoside-diphosphate kinase n=1 Tax=Flavicella sp. TaxID=2957742 RepID=UPI002636C6E0|nr:nucleoside-diphosphate kinase [Flavicella sp.]MDG1803517.1 nucleoside-diphosphate kinase [Flavicella sp.]